MHKKIDWNLLSVFMEVYRLNSITQAAEALDTTQPVVSNILRRLTEQLDEPLFTREGRGIRPTAVAVKLANDIQPLMYGISSALDNIKTFDIHKPRLFTVFVTEPILLLLQPLINKDTALGACNIQFILAPADQDEMLEQISLQKVDLAITVGSVNHHSFNVQPIHKDRMLLTCSRDHERIQGEISLDQYYEEVHVGIKVRRSGLHEINLLTEERLEERKVWVKCDSIISGLALASKSDIICLAPESIAKEYGELFNLQILELPYKTHPVIHNMISHNRTMKNHAHCWLRDKLKQHLSAC
ncbi:LysR family transcriptional regulator [Vibrio neonatus]|uniref:LysR family transcriptional regulator n=1 Tax=Vibrio neonatus TaxID=278860 RepID=UPI0021C29DB2|nr:LysR family transcriptional regulator [Vibrio neonatus]